MTGRHAFLVAVLVYVTLDLALPAMPGAFVFEPADSVESIGGGRWAVRGVVVPAPVAGSAPVVPRVAFGARLPGPRCGEPRTLDAPSMHHLARACCEPARPSEDPH
jgi:hypothetical protein